MGEWLNPSGYASWADNFVEAQKSPLEAGYNLARGDTSGALGEVSETGENLVGLTGTDPYQWRSTVRSDPTVQAQMQNLEADRQRDSGMLGSLNQALGTTGTTLKAGGDALFDNPGGSLQDTTRAVAGEGTLGSVEGLYQWSRQAAGEIPRTAGKPLGLTESSTGDALGSLVGAAGDELFFKPAETAYTLATGRDPTPSDAGTAKGGELPENEQAGNPEYAFDFLAPGAGKAIKAGAKGAMSILSAGDEALYAAWKGTGELNSLTDEAAAFSRQSGDMANMGVYGQDFSGRLGGMADLSRNPVGTGTTIDDLSSLQTNFSEFDEFETAARNIQLTDNFVKSLDTVSAQSVDELFQSGDELGGRVAQELEASVDEFARYGEDFRAVRTGEDTFKLVPESEEIASTFDEVFKVGVNSIDESVRQGGSFVDEVGGRAMSGIRKAINRVTPSGRLGSLVRGALGVGIVAVTLDRVGAMLGLDLSAVPVLGGSEPPKSYTIDGITYTVDRKYAQGGVRMQAVRDEQTLGYCVVLDFKKLAVLVPGPNGGPNVKQAATREFSTPYDDRDSADAMYTQYINQMQERPGDTSPENMPKSGVFSGSLTMPKAIKQGQELPAKATVTNDSDSEATSRFVLAVAVDGEFKIAARGDSRSLGAGESSEINLSVQQGVLNVSPGKYKVAVLSTGDGPGLVTQQTLMVEQGGASKGGSGAWGDPEIVKELKMGWYLVAQPNTKTGETRFMIVGKRKDGQRIYIHPDGKARTKAHAFGNPNKAAAAYKKWVKRAKNGQVGPEETPSPEAGRPDMAGVKKDAAAAGTAGPMQGARSFARRKPMLTLALAGGIGVGGYYGYQNGWFDPVLEVLP